MENEKIPRDGYSLSVHARQQAQDRGIGLDVVGKVIQDGCIKDARESHQRQFIKDIGNCRHPVSVVVDIERKRIITVQWYKDWLQE